MDQNEYKEFTTEELDRIVNIQMTLSENYAKMIKYAETEEACDFFNIRANSAKHDAIGFRKEWIRRKNENKGNLI